MTLNGWLQILFFLLAVFLVTPVHRRLHGPGVHAPAHVARPDRAAARAADLPPDRRRRDARDALDRVRRLGPALQRRLAAGAVRDAAAAGGAALEPARLRRRRAGPGVQHRGVVHDQHQLAGVQRRVDHELFHADGRARLPQLRLGGGRHRGRHRVHPRHRAEGKGHDRQFLGRHDARVAVGAAADRDRRRAVPGLAGRRAEPQAVRHACRPSRARSRSSRRGRRRRRRSSSSSAPTAAASSTPTARIRSRTRRR